jgi:ubiquitin conjugation factor E4 B
MDPNQQPPDAPSQETMEQIRKRRLEKLGSSANSSPKPAEAAVPSSSNASPSQTPADGQDNQNESRPKINIKAAGPSADQNPFITQLSAAPTGRVGDARKRRGSDIDLASAAPTQIRKHAPPKEESIEDYADKMLSQILRITLDPTREADVHGHKLTFLPNLSQDLQESGAPLKLSADVLDSAIVEAATAAPSSRPILDYLIPCWHRVIRAIKVFRGPAPEKEEVLREARRICFSNCIFALTMPELFR